MVKIIVEDPDGKVHSLDGPVGMSLMEAIRWAGLPLRSSCSGSKACGTCHVVVDDESFARIGPPGKEEDDLLDQECDATPTSRLSCQITIDESLQNVRVRLLNPWR